MVRSRVEGVANLLDRVLVGAVVVEGGWEQAVDLAVSRPDLVVVTRSGDRCAGGIWQIGAGGGGVTGAALEEAGRQAGIAAGEAAAADTALQARRRAAADARTQHDAATRAVQVNASRRQAAADNRQRVAAELAEAISERAVATAQQQEMASRLERDRARLSELQSLLPGLEAEAEAEAARAVAERAARSRLAERTAAVAATRRDLEVRAAGLDERRSMSRRRLAEVRRPTPSPCRRPRRGRGPTPGVGARLDGDGTPHGPGDGPPDASSTRSSAACASLAGPRPTLSRPAPSAWSSCGTSGRPPNGN